MSDTNMIITGDGDFDELLTSCVRILGVKGNDYTVGSSDRLANFNRSGELLGIRPNQVLAVYWYKHVAAVLNYIKSDGQAESEPIEGRIADVVNYMLLFYKMVKENKRMNTPKHEHKTPGLGEKDLREILETAKKEYGEVNVYEITK